VQRTQRGAQRGGGRGTTTGCRVAPFTTHVEADDQESRHLQSTAAARDGDDNDRPDRFKNERPLGVGSCPCPLPWRAKRPRPCDRADPVPASVALASRSSGHGAWLRRGAWHRSHGVSTGLRTVPVTVTAPDPEAVPESVTVTEALAAPTPKCSARGCMVTPGSFIGGSDSRRPGQCQGSLRFRRPDPLTPSGPPAGGGA
jgi:hypothetical protein